VKRDLGDGIWESYHKISIVRNPWDKVVSLWKWQTKNGATNLPFKAFVMRMQRSDDWHIHTIDNHRACQTYIRFEDLSGGLKRVMERIGVPKDDQQRVLDVMPHYKDSGGSKKKDDEHAYRLFYDEQSRAHVALVYKREVAHFRYEF
jgi:hypothetical protein